MGGDGSADGAASALVMHMHIYIFRCVSFLLKWQPLATPHCILAANVCGSTSYKLQVTDKTRTALIHWQTGPALNC